MAYVLPSDDEILSLAISHFTIAHRDPVTGKAPPVGPHDFIGQQARALTSLLRSVLAGVKVADDDAVPGGIYVDATGVTRTRNSSAALDDWAETFGVPSNAPSGFGRKVAQAARGGGATAAGTPGVVVATGAQLTDPSGTVVLQLRAGFTMPGGGTKSIAIDAVTTGSAGNLPAGTVLRWTSPPPGLASTVTLSAALRDGFDVEDDVSLALRIVRRMQNRSKGGAAADFREWTEAAEDGSGALVGVARACVFPLRDGTGSVTVVPLLGGSGAARDPGATKAAQIKAWLDGLRIASDKVFVKRPRFVTGEELVITALVYPAPGFDFEWSDAGGTPSVISGSGTSVVINQDPPLASLADAIDNSDKPRIAIRIAGVVLPFVSRVTAYAASTPMAGQSTLTLETSLPTALAGGEYVLPAGGATLPVASAILAYVDSVGPSRDSGFADPLDVWEDTVSVGRVAEVALSARDAASGERVCLWSPSIGSGVGVTIQVGVGSPSGSDFHVLDNVPGQGPQVPECVAVVVKRVP